MGKSAPNAKKTTTTQNEYCTPRRSVTGLMMAGTTAPPEVAAVSKIEPVLVYAPSPRMHKENVVEKMPDCATVLAFPRHDQRNQEYLKEQHQNYHRNPAVTREVHGEYRCDDQPEEEEKQYPSRFDDKTAYC